MNKYTITENYPLPLVEDIHNAMAEAKYFSKLDALSGYHYVWISEEDRHKTAFSCKLGVFEYIKMPFGVINGPSMFQKIMDSILKKYLWKFVVLCLDDIHIFQN